MHLVEKITLKRAKEKNWLKKFEEFRPGDTVKVSVRIKEGEKERVQAYKGVVIKIQGTGMGRSFTVRKISSGVGVERTFPYSSPNIEKVEVINRGKVRRSRLYFLRDLSGRAARLNSELVVSEGEPITAETAAVEGAEVTAAAAVEAKTKKAKAEKAETKK